MEEEDDGDEAALTGGKETKSFPAIGYIAWAPAAAQRQDARDPGAADGPLDARDPTRKGTCNGAVTTMKDGTPSGSGARMSGITCSATLIAPSVVVTLARCVATTEAGALKPHADLAFGVGDTATPRLYKISKVEVHPEYAPAMGATPAQHDIAIVRLAQPVEGVTPLTLAKGTHLGSCDYVATSYANTVTPDGSCQTARKSANFCVDKGGAGGQIKAYSDNSGFCANDVGAALRAANTTELIGLQTELAGPSCAKGTAGIFLPVANYATFLSEALAAREQPRGSVGH